MGLLFFDEMPDHGLADGKIVARFAGREELGISLQLADELLADIRAVVSELRQHDGRVRAIDLDAVLGSPARPLSRAAQLAKLDQCLDVAPARFDPAHRAALIDAVDALDQLPDIRSLIDRTIGQSTPETAR